MVSQEARAAVGRKLRWFCDSNTIQKVKCRTISIITTDDLGIDEEHSPGQALNQSLTSIKKYFDQESWSMVEDESMHFVFQAFCSLSI